MLWKIPESNAEAEHTRGAHDKNNEGKKQKISSPTCPVFKHPSLGLPTQLPVTHPECFRTLRDSDTLEREKQKRNKNKKKKPYLYLSWQHKTRHCRIIKIHRVPAAFALRALCGTGVVGLIGAGGLGSSG